jgi:hypothetical protein
MLPHIPGCSYKGCEQSSRKNAPGLKCVDAEDFGNVRRVVSPLIDDVKNLCSENAAKNHENPEIPGVFAVISEALGIADADPEAQQDTQGNEESVGGEKKLSYVKELWEHWVIRCEASGIATGSV